MRINQVLSGVPIALALCGTASAQVTIVSVARSVHTGVCVHVPPDHPNWCDSFNDSNSLAGPWSSGASFGPGASSDAGFANAVAQGGQQSDVSTAWMGISIANDAWTQSGGSCSSESVANSSMAVRFAVASPTIAFISGGIINIGAAASVAILPIGGGASFSTTAASFSSQLLLNPGEYEFRVIGNASASCAATCEHNLVIRLNAQLYFEPAPCSADFDADGTADFFDYDAFVICFEGGNCPSGKTADFDGDGTVDFFDYDAFVIAFESGC